MMLRRLPITKLVVTATIVGKDGEPDTEQEITYTGTVGFVEELIEVPLGAPTKQTATAHLVVAPTGEAST